MLMVRNTIISVHSLFLDAVDTPKTDQVFTPQDNCEYSALTNFAHSLLEKMSRREDGESTKSNDNYRSGITGQGAPTTDSGKRS